MKGRVPHSKELQPGGGGGGSSYIILSKRQRYSVVQFLVYTARKHFTFGVYLFEVFHTVTTYISILLVKDIQYSKLTHWLSPFTPRVFPNLSKPCRRMNRCITNNQRPLTKRLDLKLFFRSTDPNVQLFMLQIIYLRLDTTNVRTSHMSRQTKN